MENDAKSPLILILPVALLMAMFVSSWLLLVVAIALGVAWQLWRIYQWQHLSVTLNPDFQQLITTHQGRITVADLTQKTGISGGAARWFLNRKAKEYGTQAMVYNNKGIVYHFLTVGALGSMLDHSNPDSELEEAEQAAIAPSLPPFTPDRSQALRQAELAKRLKVHASTLYKRRRQAEFTEWSQTKDPDGIAWIFDLNSRQFFPHNQPS